MFDAWDRKSHCDYPKYYAGFVPELASRATSIDAFFGDYPDGRLVSIIRDPADWFVSRRAHTKDGVARHEDLEREARLWSKMARAAERYERAYGERFLLIRFETLVRDRERVMRHFADWAGIEWHDSLLRQTFDGFDIEPNTNFESVEGVFERKSALSAEELARLRALTEDSRQRLEPLFAV